jgi:hypothetical protein
MKGLAVALGCILVFGLSDAQATQFSQSVPAGQTTKIHVYHSLNQECRPNNGVVKVLTKPAHGRVTNQLVQRVIKKDHWGRPDPCAGTLTKAFQVDYTPSAGFHGVDNFSLDVTWGGGTHEVDTYSVTVQ